MSWNSNRQTALFNARPAHSSGHNVRAVNGGSARAAKVGGQKALKRQ